MKVYPRPFRPRVALFFRHAVGCLNLGIVLPAVMVFSIVVSLPWASKFRREWLAGLLKGSLLGLGIFTAWLIIVSIARQWLQNRIEPRAVAVASSKALDNAKEKAKSARESAIYAMQWVNTAYSLFEENAYLPFCEAAENSQAYLKQCCESLAAVQYWRQDFAARLESRQHTFPDIDSEIGLLLDPRPDMQRLSKIVNAAHRNHDFALIFASRAIATAVKDGFSKLTEAVHHLEIRITESIDKLESSLTSEIRKSTALNTKILQGVQLIATRSGYVQEK